MLLLMREAYVGAQVSASSGGRRDIASNLMLKTANFSPQLIRRRPFS